MKTGKELVLELGPRLTLRRLERWVSKNYLRPELGKRGRSLAHRYTDRDVKKIRYMLEEIGNGKSAEEAHHFAEARFQEEEKPVVLAVEPDLISKRLLKAALASTCRSEVVEDCKRARGWLRLSHRPNLLIVEPRHEREAGKDLIEEAARKGIPVLISSAAFVESLRNCKFIQKPYRMGDLRSKVIGILHEVGLITAIEEEQ